MSKGGNPMGSSPHMRGARFAQNTRDEVRRIIPAYAGSTWWPQRPMPCIRDHPRICGEHAMAFDVPTLPLGSSPHMRGARPLRHPQHDGAGIIPAYAGSTGCIKFRDCWVWDHPRICGEHPSLSFEPSVVLGSSPHMRGAPCVVVVANAPAGIIPAYAGSTRVSNFP